MIDVTTEEPTEAPRAQSKAHPWTDTGPHPWRRFFARLLDIAINAAISFFIVGFVGELVAHEWMARWYSLLAGPFGTLIDSYATVVIAIPLTALMIGLTGGSVGKWIFGIRVVREDGRPLGVWRAFVRELWVFTQGMGLALPIVTLIFMWRSYETLTEDEVADWDMGNLVTQRTDGFIQTVLTIVGVLVLLAIRAAFALPFLTKLSQG